MNGRTNERLVVHTHGHTDNQPTNQPSFLPSPLSPCPTHLVLLDLGKAEVPPVLGRPLADGGGDVELLGRRVAGGRGSSGPELDGEGHGRLLLGVRVHLLAPAAILGGRRGAGGGGGVRVGLGERRRGGRAGGGRGGAGLLGALRLGLGWGVAAQLPLRVCGESKGGSGVRGGRPMARKCIRWRRRSRKR